MKANYFVKKQKREIIYIYIRSIYIHVYIHTVYICIYTESFQNINIAIHEKNEALDEEN